MDDADYRKSELLKIQDLNKAALQKRIDFGDDADPVLIKAIEKRLSNIEKEEIKEQGFQQAAKEAAFYARRTSTLALIATCISAIASVISVVTKFGGLGSCS